MKKIEISHDLSRPKFEDWCEKRARNLFIEPKVTCQEIHGVDYYRAFRAGMRAGIESIPESLGEKENQDELEKKSDALYGI